MADYIYLLETQLSPAQRRALSTIREVVRNKGLTLFLTGGAVRDLTAGARVRDLDVTVQGNPLKLKKELEKAGAIIDGEREDAQSLYLWFPGGARVELSAAMSVTFPKPGKPAYKPTSILDDLRSRDFTANAMAISLNEGSFGLLMDPLNGVADIENREFRLVSNYGFIEDPVRAIRGTRLSARLGWQFEEKTAQRYKTAKEEGYISALSPFWQGYELEEIAHEEEPPRIMRSLESEGWMKHLFPAWGAAKVNSSALNELQIRYGQLGELGIFSDSSPTQFPLLVAKLQPKDITALKKKFPRQGFVKRMDSLESRTKDFQTKFMAKENATPSAAWKFVHASDPELVLSLYVNGKGAPIQNKFKALLNEWPTAKQRIPYQLMQEMRITPDLPVYAELVDKLFFELMDNKLSTPEEMKAYLEPFSPPAPPPPPTLRRPRKVKEGKAPRARKKAAVEAPQEGVEVAATSEQQATDQKSASKKAGKEKSAPTPVAAKKAAPEKKAPEKKAAAPAPKKAVPAKKPAPPAKKPAAKKAAPVKKAPAKKIAVKKPVAKKTAPVKKQQTKKVVAKKAPANKQAAKKAPAKKSAKRR